MIVGMESAPDEASGAPGRRRRALALIACAAVAVAAASLAYLRPTVPAGNRVPAPLNLASAQTQSNVVHFYFIPGQVPTGGAYYVWDRSPQGNSGGHAP
jgi:hypothetical protein